MSRILEFRLEGPWGNTVNLHFGGRFVGEIEVEQYSYDSDKDDLREATDEEKFKDAANQVATELRHILRCVK